MRTHSGTLPRVKPPEVLSFREFRAGLAATFRQVQEPDAEPVYVGAHRRPEAVVMSVAHYRDLVAASQRREALVQALGPVRAPGLGTTDDRLQTISAIAHRGLNHAPGVDQLRPR